jgi:hypothetical protein
MRKPRHRYTPEEIRFLDNNITGRSYAELTELFNAHFGLRGNKKITLESCSNVLKRNGIKNGLKNNLFLPGHHSRTELKKGHTINKISAVGSEHINNMGYVLIKTDNHNTWKNKHVFLWEQKNGPVPKGHVIIFLDRNKMNLSLDNLIMITKKEHVFMNSHKLYSPDVEFTMAGLLMAKIIIQANERLGKSRKSKRKTKEA